MKPAKNLIIVETPLQLLCGYEAWCLCEKNADFLIRLTGRGLNDKHMINAAKLLGITYATIKLRPSHFSLDFSFNLIALLKLNKKYDSMYLGSFNSRGIRVIAKLLRKKKLWYMDDGASTCLISDKIKKANLNHHFFSFFDGSMLPINKTVRHDFSNIKKLFDVNGVSDSYFIGQPVFRMNHIEENTYISCIERSVELSEKKEIIYIPHRVEDERTLERISNVSGVKIFLLDECVELFFLKKGVGPKRLYSLYSTALFTLSIMFPNCKATAYYPSSNKKNKEADNNFEIIKIYDALERFDNIEILDH